MATDSQHLVNGSCVFCIGQHIHNVMQYSPDAQEIILLICCASSSVISDDGVLLPNSPPTPHH